MGAVVSEGLQEEVGVGFGLKETAAIRGDDSYEVGAELLRRRERHSGRIKERPGALAVKFQEVVVHSIENCEAEVAKQQHHRRSNGLPPSCSTDDLQSRATCPECCGKAG